MPTPTRFTADRRARILEILSAGASLREAARSAGVSHSTLIRWLQRGAKAHPGGTLNGFYRAVEAVRGSDPHLVAIADQADEWDRFPGRARARWMTKDTE
jgi:IS30 family transposase